MQPDTGIKAGGRKEELSLSPPLPLFSLLQQFLLAEPICMSSQPGSLGDAVTGGQLLGHRGGRGTGEPKAEEPAQCNSNRAQEMQPLGLLVYVLVTFRDYLALLNNVTTDIYVGAHLCLLGNWKQHFLGRVRDIWVYSFPMRQSWSLLASRARSIAHLFQVLVRDWCREITRAEGEY